MNRAFVAADVDDAILDAAAALAAELPLRARWVKRGLMHCTVRFFGDVGDDRLAELAARVASLPGAPIALRARRLDAFPKPRRAHVLVLDLEDDGSLARIHAELGAEERPYRPHLTLARFKEPADLRSTVQKTSLDVSGRVTAVTLYTSRLGSDGPTYTAVTARALDAP